MIGRRKNWCAISLISLTIGSTAGIGQITFEKSIDSLLPDPIKVTTFSRPGSITFLSTNQKIIQKIGPATREKVPAGLMPESIKKAFIAAEDRRFYQHKGVDLWSICRAILINLREGFIREGGSTITQQLARIVFLNHDKSIIRKVKEAALAYKLERQLSKQEIIEQYLNHVYLGSGAYGIADAAWIYFKKSVNDLSIGEIALIAGLSPAPSLYSPLVNPDLSIKQRAKVLTKMLKEDFIDKETYKKVIRSPLILNPGLPKYFNSHAPFFTSWVTQKLPLILTREQLELGGLIIRTSLNLSWQKEAQELVQRNSPKGTEGAIVSIEPKSGLVRILVGGKNFEATQFNRATQALRSPGSTFKVFPYAAALNKGYRTNDLFIDKKECWVDYCPKNFGNKYMGKVSLVDSFKYSLNTIAVQILDKVGFEEVISIANKLGVGNERKLGKYYPMAIGAYEQTVIDMAAAYAGITNRGRYISPTPIEEIRGPGNMLLWSNKRDGDKGHIALKKEVADSLNWMLEKAINEGTGKAAKLDDRPVTGKTGTSEGGRDLWFIGSIPQLTTAIWFGYDNNQKTNISSGESAYAWKNLMQKISKDLKVIKFPHNSSRKIKY